MKKNIKIISTILTSCALMFTSINASAVTVTDLINEDFETKLQENAQWDTSNNYNYTKMWNKDVYICQKAQEEWYNQYNNPDITTDYSKWKGYDDYLNYLADANDNSKIGILSVSDNIKNQTDVTIPGEIDGKTVAGIYKKLFWRANIENVVIPDSIEYIGESAFYECFNLKSITIPEGVTKIEEYAFFDAGKNTEISELVIPKSVKKIGEWGIYFGDNSKERTITLSKDVIFYAIRSDGSYIEKKVGDMNKEEIGDFVGYNFKLKFYEDEPGYVPPVSEETPENPPVSDTSDDKPTDSTNNNNNNNNNNNQNNSDNNNNQNNNNNQTEQKPQTGDTTTIFTLLSTAAGLLVMKKSKK